MSNPDYVGIEGETFTEDELEDNFQDYLDNEMPEFTFGNLSYGAGRVLREIDYTAFREAFNDWIDSADHIDEWHEGHPWLDEDGPVCEDCGEDMDQDEVTEALADHGRLFCQSCEEDQDMDYCYECDKVTEWNDEKCAGCGRTWGYDKGEGPDDQ